jgi:CheY-like chemotaxis protein
MARVLIVDDDVDASEALVRVLRHRGHDATWVGNGRTAMALLIADTPDFAVFDFKMPGMTGLELLKATRSYLRLQHLPAVIVTAYPEAPELRDIDQLDIIGVIPKVNLDLPHIADLVDRHAGPGKPPIQQQPKTR